MLRGCINQKFLRSSLSINADCRILTFIQQVMCSRSTEIHVHLYLLQREVNMLSLKKKRLHLGSYMYQNVINTLSSGTIAYRSTCQLEAFGMPKRQKASRIWPLVRTRLWFQGKHPRRYLKTSNNTPRMRMRLTTPSSLPKTCESLRMICYEWSPRHLS